MIYDRAQKKSSSWQPTHQQPESQRLPPRHSFIPPQVEAKSQESAEIPVYSRVDRDLITAKILKAAENRVVEPIVPVQRSEEKTGEAQTPVELVSQEVVAPQGGELDAVEGVGVSSAEAIQLKCAECSSVEEKSSIAENSVTESVVQRSFDEEVVDNVEVAQPVSENLTSDEVVQRSPDEEVVDDVEVAQPVSENLVTEEVAQAVSENPTSDEEVVDDAEVAQPVSENLVADEVVQRSPDEEVVDNGEVSQPVSENLVTESVIQRSPDEEVVDNGEVAQPVSENSVTEEVAQTVSENPTSDEELVDETEAAQPVSEKSVTESVVQRSPDEEVVDNGEVAQPVSENSVTEEVAQPVSENPTSDEELVDETEAAQPVSEKSVTESVVQRSPDEEVVDNGEAAQPVSEKSVADEEVVDETEAAQPVSEKSVTESVIQRSPDEEVVDETEITQPVSENPITEIPEEEEIQSAPESETIQRKTTSNFSPQPQINLSPTSSGNPLPPAIQKKMERAFSTNFNNVRIHTENQAKSINAQAYTQGNNIHFAPGKYNPDTTSGQELLGHELTHVVQQKAGKVSVPQGKSLPINADTALEAEADELGAKAARGEKVTVAGTSANLQESTPTIAPIQGFGLLNKIKNAVKSKVKSGVKAVKNKVKATVNVVKNKVKATVNAVKNKVKQGVKSLKNQAKSFANKVKGKVKQGVNKVKSFANKVGSKLKSVGNKVKGKVNQVVNKGKTWANKAKGKFNQVINKLKSVGNKAKGKFNQVINKLKSVGKKAKGKFNQVINKLKSVGKKGKGKFNQVINKLKSVGKKGKGKFNQVINKLKSVGKKGKGKFNQFVNKLKSVGKKGKGKFNQFVNKGKTWANKAKGKFNQIVNKGKTWANKANGKLKQGVNWGINKGKQTAKKLKNTAQNLSHKGKNALSQVTKATGNWGTNAGQNALEYWANVAVAGENQGGLAGFGKQVAGTTFGSLAALWTKENAGTTAFTLGTAGLGAMANAGRLGGYGLGAMAQVGKAAQALEPVGKGMMLLGGFRGGVSMGEGIGGQDIWGNTLTNEERLQHFGSGALGAGLSFLGGVAAAGKLGALSQPTLAGVATYGTFSDGQDIGAAMTGRDIEGNSLSLPDRLARGGMGLLGALDLASPGGKYPLTPESGPKLHETTPELNLPLLPGAKGNDSSIIPLIPPKLHEEVNVPSVIHPPNRGTDGLNLPLIHGQKNGDNGDIIPLIPTRSEVTTPSGIHPQNRSGETTTHPHHPEIEPGVVAKEKTHDGHEIKVLKDGRVVRCSDCGEIRNKYAEQLEQKPELKQRLEQIEKIANPQEKAKQAQQLEQELASEQKKIIDPKTGQPFGRDSQQKLLDHQGQEFAQELASTEPKKIIDPKTGKPFGWDSQQKLLDHQGRVLDNNNATRKEQGIPEHPGVELHNHFGGILRPAKLIKLAYGDNPREFLNHIWSIEAFKKNPQIKNVFGEFIKEDGSLDLSQATESDLKDMANRLMTANEDVDFGLAYTVRGQVVNKIENKENYANAIVEQLKTEQIKYAELQAEELKGIDLNSFRQKCAESGIQVRFLVNLSTGTLQGQTGKKSGVQKMNNIELGKSGKVGVDFAGPEKSFDPRQGKDNFKEIYKNIKQQAEDNNASFVLRPHVGEGFHERDKITGKLKEDSQHRQQAEGNLDIVLKGLEELQIEGELSDKVIVRFGHATHATPAQLQKIKDLETKGLKIIVEANLTSNLKTHSIEPEEQDQVLLKFLYHDISTILNTDGGGVMGTSLADEYKVARRIINRFRDGVTSLKIGDKEYRFTDLTPEQQARFDIERLKKEAQKYLTDIAPTIKDDLE